jgi:adenylate cyclase
MTSEPNEGSANKWTFAMVDLAGFTALTEAHGDDDAADLAVTFANLAAECLDPGDCLVTYR